MRSSEMLLSDEPSPAWLLGDEIPSDCWAGIIVTRSAAVAGCTRSSMRGSRAGITRASSVSRKPSSRVTT